MALQVTLPREYGKGLRVGQWLKVESVGDTVVLAVAEEKVRYAEPEIFVGSIWDGLSFELPPDRVLEFLTVLSSELKPSRTVLYYTEDGNDRQIEVLNGDLRETLARIGNRLLDHTFSADFDQHTLFSGGDGCFSLRADLPKPKLREVAQSVLKLLGVDHQIDRDDFQIGVIGGATEIYR